MYPNNSLSLRHRFIVLLLISVHSLILFDEVLNAP